MMTQRQSAIVLALLATLYGCMLVLFAPELDFFNSATDFRFPAAVVGLVVAAPAFLALWAVLGRQRATVRLPLTAWLCSMYFLAAIYGEVRYFGAGESDIVLLLLVAWVTAYLADLLLLRLLRAVRGWRLERIETAPVVGSGREVPAPASGGIHGQDARATEAKRQFTIRTSLAWTAAVAALLAGLRWLSPYGVFDAALWESFDALVMGAVVGSIFALAGLPVVSVSLIILADGRRTIWRCVLASLTALGIWGGVSVTGPLLADQPGDEIVMLGLAIETGVLLAGAAAASLTRACGYRLRRNACSRIRENSGPDSLSRPDFSRSRLRFAFAVAPLVTAALLLAGYAPRRLETWRRADETQRWESLGWHAEFDDEGHVTGLTSFGEGAIADLKALAHELAPHLKFLQLSDGLSELPPLPKLETLIMDDASDAGLSHLERFPNVEILSVSGHGVTDEGLPGLVHLTKLKELCLSETLVRLEQLLPPTPFAHLRNLNLRGTFVGDRALSHLELFPNLETLNLGRTNVTERGLGALGGLESLTTLDLGMTDIGDESLPALKGLSRLRSLNLELTAVSEAGFRELRGALADTSITAGADDLTIERATFSFLSYKQGLGPVMTTRGSQKVMLTHLHARGRHLTEPPETNGVVEKPGAVTDDGLAMLSGQTAMEDLDLRDSAVTDAGLKSLAKLTNLKRLDLRGTQVTEHGCQRLAKTLPGCEVLR